MTQICGERGLCSSCGARASRWHGSSSCRGWALGRSGSRSCSAWAQGLWLPGAEASGVVAQRLQEWWRTGFRSGGAQASGVVAHRLSCSEACGIFLDQGSNLCPLSWRFFTTEPPAKPLNYLKKDTHPTNFKFI